MNGDFFRKLLSKRIRITGTTVRARSVEVTFANILYRFHNEPSHLNLQCLPSSLIFQHNKVYNESLFKLCRHNFVVCFFATI